VTLLAVALVVLGCGGSDQGQETVAQVLSGTDHLVGGDLGTPPRGGRSTVDHLDPDLLAAFRAAERDARDDGVRLVITSGWRSREHQQRLLDEAVVTYGSLEEALRYVSTPDTSAHVTGHAVDVGPTDADDWLGQHGADYGLCQVFANEIWHYELATTPGGSCPEMLPDSSYRG
jgi:D-alanyl-D-alanine carboxypeptidase